MFKIKCDDLLFYIPESLEDQKENSNFPMPKSFIHSFRIYEFFSGGCYRGGSGTFKLIKGVVENYSGIRIEDVINSIAIPKRTEFHIVVENGVNERVVYSVKKLGSKITWWDIFCVNHRIC